MLINKKSLLYLKRKVFSVALNENKNTNFTKTFPLAPVPKGSNSLNSLLYLDNSLIGFISSGELFSSSELQSSSLLRDDSILLKELLMLLSSFENICNDVYA